MINSFSFAVPGLAVGKQRPRKGPHGFYTPQKTQDYEELIKYHALSALNRLVKMNLGFLWRFDQKYYIKIEIGYKSNPRRIPDIDNVIKCILDGLNRIIYDDDKSVYKLFVERKMNQAANQVTIEVSYET